MTGEEQLVIVLFLVFTLLIFAIAVLVQTMSKVKRERSYNYRKYLTDMYVAGRIRQEAEKDKVNLDKEANEFKDYMELFRHKDNRIDLDDDIEENLSKKISNRK